MIYEKYIFHPESVMFGKSKLGLARFLGATQGRAQHWEKGRVPNADDCLTISQKLGFNLPWVIRGEGGMELENTKRVQMQTLHEDTEERIAELKYTIELQKKMLEAYEHGFMGNNIALGTGSVAHFSHHANE